MKKIISLLVVIVMIATMATTAFAAKAGETVTVDFKVSGNPGIGSYNAVINVPAGLELVEVVEGDVVAPGAVFFANGVNVGYMGMKENATNDGVLFSATFTIAADAEAGTEYTITADVVEGSACNVANEPIEFEIQAATITVEGHKHNYVKTIVKEATCDEAGLATYTCECGDSYNEEIPALGHDLVEHEAKAATCTEHGWAAYVTCSRCDYTTYVEIAALGHKWGKWLQHNETHHKRICSVCEEVEYEAHYFGDDDICDDCGYKREGIDPVPGTGDITPVVVTTAFAVIALITLAGYMLKRKFAL